MLSIALAVAACSAPGPLAGRPTTSPARVSSPAPAPAPSAQVVPAVAVVDLEDGGGGYKLSLVSAEGKVLASRHASWPYGGKCGPVQAGIISPPPVSTSNTRAYFLDEGGIKWLQEDGQTGLALGPLSPRANVAVGFAVSPDDSKVAINAIDYSSSPLVQHLTVTPVGASVSPVGPSVSPVGASGRGAEIYTAAAPASNPTAAVWPMGWHGGDIVLAYHVGTCSQGGGPGLADAKSYHVVDSTTADREVTIGEDSGSACGLMGLPTPAGIPCGSYQGIGAVGTEVRTWTGGLRGIYGAWFLPGGLSPSGDAYVGVFQSAPSAQPALTLIRAKGNAVPIAGVSESVLWPVMWIDDGHFFIGGLRPHEQGRVFASNPEPLPSTPVAVGGVPVARIPGSLD